MQNMKYESWGFADNLNGIKTKLFRKVNKILETE